MVLTEFKTIYHYEIILHQETYCKAYLRETRKNTNLEKELNFFLTRYSVWGSDVRMKGWRIKKMQQLRSRVHNTALADELKWWSKKFGHRLKLNMNTNIYPELFKSRFYWISYNWGIFGSNRSPRSQDVVVRLSRILFKLTL